MDYKLLPSGFIASESMKGYLPLQIKELFSNTKMTSFSVTPDIYKVSWMFALDDIIRSYLGGMVISCREHKAVMLQMEWTPWGERVKGEATYSYGG